MLVVHFAPINQHFSGGWSQAYDNQFGLVISVDCSGVSQTYFLQIVGGLLHHLSYDVLTRTYTKYIKLFVYVKLVSSRQRVGQTLPLKASTMKKYLSGSSSS